ncbi:MAG: translocation/assembly module TamB [Parachlamydiaceae bacterium]|nr:translocation/assembly module TamB [Parachlamydiaceae bacterium]
MNFIRNIFCFLVIILALGVILVNTETVRNRVKEVIQDEFKKNTGSTLAVEDVEFDFPRSVLLHNISISDTPQGTFTAKNITLTTPLLKLILGDRKEISATIDIDGVKADNPTLAQLPSSLRTSVIWKEEDRVIEGELFRLESTNLTFPYALENKKENLDSSQESNSISKGEFKIVLAAPTETFHTFSCTLDRVKTVGFVLEDVKGSGKWDVLKNHGKFSLLAKNILYGFYSLSNFGIEIENDPITEQWHYEFSTNGMATDPFKAAAKGLFGVVDGIPQLMFNILDLESGMNSVILTKPCQVRLEENFNFVIDQSHLCINEKDMSLSGRTNLEDINLNLSVKEQFFNFTLPGELLPMSGVLTGTCFCQGTLANLHGDAEFNVKTFSYTFPGEISPLTGDFSGTISLQGNADNFHGASELNLKSFSYIFPGENAPRFEGLSGTISLLGKPENLHGGAQFKIKSFDYNLAEASVPIKGALSGKISLEGALDNLRGGAELLAHSITFDHPFVSKKSQFQVGLSATLFEDAIALKGAVHDKEDKLLDVEGHCPIERGKGEILAFSAVKEMAVHFSGKFDIVKYFRKAISSDLWLTGDLVAEGNINGPVHAPKFKGNVHWNHGTLEHWESGILFHSAQADFNLKDDKITLNSLQALDEVGGKVMAAGIIDLTSTLDFPFSVNLSIDKSRLLNIENTSVVLSGNGALKGNINGATLKGDFKADSVDIFVKESSSVNNTPMDVIYLNQNPNETLPTQLNTTTAKWPICYDIRVQNKGNIAIYNKEFSSEWKGDLKIAGCNNLPLFSGDLRLLKGEYLFKGKKLKVVEGTISFAGDLKKKTTLYVVVEMEIDRIVAQIVLKGPIDNPLLEFRSTPPMSQREILSWVIFGRGPKDITPYEGSELVQSLSDLKGSGGGSSENLLSRLKESLGIDRIDISGGDGGLNEEISLQVGKYILPEVFLGIKRNMNSDVNRIGIEASIIKDVKIEAEVGDHDAGATFHLKWKHDY